jgi:hypothetical protein
MLIDCFKRYRDFGHKTAKTCSPNGRQAERRYPALFPLFFFLDLQTLVPRPMIHFLYFHMLGDGSKRGLEGTYRKCMFIGQLNQAHRTAS